MIIRDRTSIGNDREQSMTIDNDRSQLVMMGGLLTFKTANNRYEQLFFVFLPEKPMIAFTIIYNRHRSSTISRTIDDDRR